MDTVVNALKHWEGCCSHMYLDTRGNVTTGIGHLLRTAADARVLPWVDIAGDAAQPGEIQVSWETVHAAATGRPASGYEALTHIRLRDGMPEQLARTRIEREFLPGLRVRYPAFDYYPASARGALLDMAWNLGLHGLDQFKHMHDAIKAGDWFGASVACHRSSSRQERNEWCAEQFEQAEASDTMTPGPVVG